MGFDRRKFLLGGLAAGTVLPLRRAGLPAFTSGHGCGVGAETLVVVQARGGFDFLNMLIEPDHVVYQAARPNLAIPRSRTLAFDARYPQLAWHPSMQGFKTLYDRGELAVVANVGYPTPDLSHFASERKWVAADPSVSSAAGTGWLANYLLRAYTGGFQIPAIVLGRYGLAFQGTRVTSVQDIGSFGARFDVDPRTVADLQLEMAIMGSNAAWARPQDPLAAAAAAGSVQALADAQMLQQTGGNYVPRASYPAISLSTHLRDAARLIVGGLQTQIYYLDDSSWDHHSYQSDPGVPEGGQLGAKLGGFGTGTGGLTDAIRAFVDDLKAWGVANKVVILVFSEFGRRIGENGALGTDHGHGGIAFVAGEPVSGGLYGSYPDLSAYNNGTGYEFQYLGFDQSSTDFRSIYATLIDRWLLASHGVVLGSTFPLLGFL